MSAMTQLYYRFSGNVEAALDTPYWLIKVVLVSAGLTLFLSCPPYTLVVNHLNGHFLDAWTFIDIQSHSLLHPHGIDLDVRRENMVFRWTLPVLYWLTGRHLLVMLGLQFLIGLGFLYLAGRMAYKITEDKLSATFFTVAIAHIFVGVWQFADIHGYGDGVAYFFLLLAMLSRNYAVIAISLLVVCFTDERAVISVGFALFWWLMDNACRKNEFGLPEMIRQLATPRYLIAFLVLGAYFISRYYVINTYFSDHHYSTIGHLMYFEPSHKNGLGGSFWRSFEGLWILALAAMAILWTTDRRILFGMAFICFLVMLGSELLVHDMDRTLSYGFPMFFVSLLVVKQASSTKHLRIFLFLIMIICVSHPQLFYMGYNKILWLEPLPLKLFHLFYEGA